MLIAGDSAYLDVPESGRDTYSQYAFWDWASEHYKQVIVCLGNHDFYGYYDLAISASMLLEGGLLNMIYQPPFFHVALETITSALIDGTQEVINPPMEKQETGQRNGGNTRLSRTALKHNDKQRAK